MFGDREVASELEAVIRSQPLRERLRGQQMHGALPLRPPGGCAQRLRRRARMLSEELGIEPSSALKQLERDILNQDSSLAPPPRETVPQAEAEAAPRRRRRTGVLFAGAAAAIVAVAAVVAPVDALRLSRQHRITADRGRATRSHPTLRELLGGRLASDVLSPSARVPCGHSIPVTARSRASTARLHHTRMFSPGLPLGDIAAGVDALWVIDQAGARVARIDGRSLAVNPPIALASRGASSAPLRHLLAQVIAVGGGSVWAPRRRSRPLPHLRERR